MFSNWRETLGRAFALRLALWYVGLFVVSALALSGTTYVLLARALAAQDHEVLEAMLARYASEYVRSGLAGLRETIESDAGQGRHERLLVRVTDDQTEVVYFTAPQRWSAFDLAPLDAPDAHDGEWTTIGNAPDNALLEVGTVRLPNNVKVQVGRSSHVREELLAHFRARGAELLALILLAAFIGGVLLTIAGLAPLRALDATVGTILSTGRLDARVSVKHGNDPLDQLGDRVNQMLARIEQLVAGMRAALDNVAHDLRTPLTRFRTVAETALISGDPTQVRDGLARAVEEADRVGATLTALMDISEAETGTMTLARVPVRLQDVIDEALSLYADEAEDKGIDITSEVVPTTRVIGDRTRLRQVVANLIENAVKYTNRGGRVLISAVATGDGFVELRIRDSGLGVAPEHLPQIWERLYRADSSRATRGIGLGLSLVRAVVEAHGGHVDVESAPGQGSTFKVMLPEARV